MYLFFLYIFLLFVEPMEEQPQSAFQDMIPTKQPTAPVEPLGDRETLLTHLQLLDAATWDRLRTEGTITDDEWRQLQITRDRVAFIIAQTA